VVAFVVVPDIRERLGSALVPLLGAFLIGCAIAAPILGYALADFESGSFNDPALFPADLVNIVVPTELTLVGGERAAAISRDFGANLAENGAYLGLPLLIVLGWFAWQRRRQPAARLLVVLLVLGVVAELGVALRVRGDRVMALPWALAERIPALSHVLPVRFTMYVALGAAATVAIWASSPRPARWLRATLVAAVVISLVPAVSRNFWSTTPSRPDFFADSVYRMCFRPDETVFVPSALGIDATLWQAESGYRFRIANGALGPRLPEGIPEPDIAAAVVSDVVPEGGGAAVVRHARKLLATVIMLEPEDFDRWGPPLEEAGLEPVDRGGVRLYHLRRPLPSCSA
jgi:hypothetical protein